MKDNKYEIKLDAKLPMEYHSIVKSIIIDMIKIGNRSEFVDNDDEVICSLAYGKTIWQKFMFPLLKDVADELDLDPSDLSGDIYKWMEYCRN